MAAIWVWRATADGGTMRWCVPSLVVASVLAIGAARVAAQSIPASPSPTAAAPAEPAPAADPLGRQTPRGSVRGFLGAARNGDTKVARQYLDTRLDETAAQQLAHQLYVVLDAMLPARLTQISDEPLGSRANPLAPNLETIGVIASPTGEVEVIVDRIERKGQEPIWLFSSATLRAIPALYQEVGRREAARRLPDFVDRTGLGGLKRFEWLVLIGGIPLFFVAAAWANRALVVIIRPFWHRFAADDARPLTSVLPLPARLLIFALAVQWLLPALPLSLRVRQFCSSAAGALAIAAVVSLLILLNAEIERAIQRRISRSDPTAIAALLRVLRRVVDVAYVVVGLGVLLRHFGVDSTPALAGVGVGGIAVALAAQKTLENVIAGASLIFDQAVKVGDFLKIGEVAGTVEHIGLRSTRIRTPDRTVVSIPNSQIAGATLETMSARDKFWFHPEVRLRYETTPAQLRSVLDGCRQLLASHPSVQREDQRVRFHRVAQYSFDVEIFAYVLVRNWDEFLKVQEQLLFGVTEAVERSGTAFAIPSQRTYVAGRSTRRDRESSRSPAPLR
jgi:MscS family membrane protein